MYRFVLLTGLMRVSVVLGALTLALLGMGVSEGKDATVVEKGLVAYWPLDKGKGSEIHDVSGHENHGTIIGAPTWTDGVVGSALKFNGVSYIDCKDNENIRVSEAVTIMFWFKLDEDFHRGSESLGVYEKRGTCRGSLFNGNAMLYMNFFGLKDETTAVSSPDRREDIGACWRKGRWYHIAVTYERAKNLQVFYVNGKKKREQENSGAIATTFYNFYIGRNGGYRGFKGKIDEFKIYNKALTADEIKAEHIRGIGMLSVKIYLSEEPQKEGLVGYWPMDEGKGLTICDASAWGNHGVIHGAAWTVGRFGSALEFDGRDDYVACGNDPSLNIKDVFTIMAWVKFNVVSTYNPIVNKQESYNLYAYRDKPMELHVWDARKRSYRSGGSPINPPVGRWIHYAGTYDGQYLRLYLNGEPEGSNDVGTFSLIQKRGHLEIGRIWSAKALRSFNGTIDEVKIYNRALSKEEIKSYYQEGLLAENVAGKNTRKVCSRMNFDMTYIGRQR